MLDESSKRQFTFSEGKPSAAAYVLYRPFDKELRPLEVANQIVPSRVSSPSLIGWYRILRAHHQWTVFQAIRYALWLAR